MSEPNRKIFLYHKESITRSKPLFVVDKHRHVGGILIRKQHSKNLRPFKLLMRKLVLAGESWSHFCRTTTGHGFGHIVDKVEPIALRFFWTLAVVGCAIAMLYSVASVTEKALVKRSVRSELIHVRNSTMELPDIHICDTSLFNSSVLSDLGFDDTLASYLALALAPAISASTLRNDSHLQNNLRKRLDSILMLKNMTISDVFRKAVLTCEDMVMGCVHQTIRYTREECCEKIFQDKTYPSFMGSCISSHGIEDFVERIASQVYGFTVFLRTNVHHRIQFDTMIVSPTIGSKIGAVYAVSDQLSHVSGVVPSTGQYATPATWNSISITLARTDNTEWISSPLAPKLCIPPRDENFRSHAPGFDVYSHENCISSAMQKQFEHIFNCSVYGLPRDSALPYCHPSVLLSETAHTIASKDNYIENCPEDCIMDTYTTVPSATIMVLSNYDDMHHIEHSDSDLVGLQFYFPTFTFSVIINHPQSFVTWLGEIGGNMGLYLGASIVTILEFLVALILFVLRCCRPETKRGRRRKKSRRSRISVHSIM